MIEQMTSPLVTARADLRGQRRDRAGLVRVERLLHLHRLEDDHQVAGLDLLAFLNRDLDDRALHRAAAGVSADGGPDFFRRPPPRSTAALTWPEGGGL
jgi:hypothetical protein